MERRWISGFYKDLYTYGMMKSVPKDLQMVLIGYETGANTLAIVKKYKERAEGVLICKDFRISPQGWGLRSE